MNNPQASITFAQDGAAITFSGKDVTGNTGFAFMDIGYSPGSDFEQQMLSAAGMSGGQNFTFSFSYHGDLPGSATFDITTNISEGSKVNVYRFDAGTGAFTQIASGVTVGPGGVTTYQNNTMSDYLITTNTIRGALKQSGPVNWLLYVIIAGAALLIAAGAVVLIMRKKKRGRTPQPATNQQ